jgi:hypothetical protein
MFVSQSPLLNSDSVLKDKWGRALEGGFQLIPNVLIRAQKRLGLDAVDVVVLLNLNLHWWGATNLPFPRPAMIANRMGVSKRTVERRLHRLAKNGFIQRLPPVNAGGGIKVRPYRLSGLVEKLQVATDIGLAQRSYRRSDDSDE